MLSGSPLVLISSRSNAQICIYPSAQAPLYSRVQLVHTSRRETFLLARGWGLGTRLALLLGWWWVGPGDEIMHEYCRHS